MTSKLDARRREDRHPDPVSRWETLCLTCGRWFGAARSSARYCSMRCRVGALRPRWTPREEDDARR